MRKMELFEVAQWLHQYEQYRKEWFKLMGKKYDHPVKRELHLLIGSLYRAAPDYHKYGQKQLVFDDMVLQELLDLIVEPEYHQDIKNALYANGYQAPVL